MVRDIQYAKQWSLGSHLVVSQKGGAFQIPNFRGKRNEHIFPYTGELGYDGPLYDGFLHMTDDMLGPSPLHIKYSSYV